MKRTHIFAAATLLAAVFACSDQKGVGPDGQGELPPKGWNVSEPGSLAATNNRIAAPASVSSAEEFAYISAEPGTIASGLLVKVRNTTLATEFVTVDIVDGGFDPVTVPARAGDNLDVRVITVTHDVIAFTVTVPPKRPPIIVRTSPTKGRVDIALNQVFTTVFSEPVDPSTVNAASIKLLVSGTVVPGVLALSADGLSASLTPNAELAPSTNYELVITTQIRDRDGDALTEGESIIYRTVASAGTSQNFPSGPSSVRIVFQHQDDNGGTHLYTMNADGSDKRQLTSGSQFEGSPSVSSDGKRIAYVREGAIYVMNADGSNDRFLTLGGAAPRWSPDGSRIAFADLASTGISIINADGTGLVKLVESYALPKNDADPSWSPDAGQIVFWRWEDQEFSVVWIMNSDGTNARRVGRQEPFGTGIRTWASWGPYWSASGRIYFAGPDNGYAGTVWSMGPDGAGPGAHATFGGQYVLEVSDVLPDASWLTFTMSDRGPTDIYLLNAANAVRQVTHDGRSSSAAFLR